MKKAVYFLFSCYAFFHCMPLACAQSSGTSSGKSSGGSSRSSGKASRNNSNGSNNSGGNKTQTDDRSSGKASRNNSNGSNNSGGNKTQTDDRSSGKASRNNSNGSNNSGGNKTQTDDRSSGKASRNNSNGSNNSGGNKTQADNGGNETLAFDRNIGNDISRDNRGTTRGCTSNGNSTTCSFDPGNINFSPTSVKDLELSINGTTVTCERRRGSRMFGASRGNDSKRKRWQGTCNNGARDVNMLEILDDDGVPHTFGTLSIGGEICRFGEDANGQSISICEVIDLEELDPPAPIETNSSNDDERLLQASEQKTLATPFLRSKRQNYATNSSRRLYDDSGGVLDVMVVWTREAECLQSVLPVDCTPTSITTMNMQGLIALAIEETNEAFDVSGVQTQLRLVHSYRHPTYEEPSTNQFFSALQQLQRTNDGVMDDVHELRELYGADIVAMILGTGPYCGVAYPGPQKNLMFSVTKYQCATGYFSFGHEIAHNIGCKHDRGTRNECNVTDNADFGYGYRDPQSSFRSILAYGCTVNQCDNLSPPVSPDKCERVQFFSNDENTYNNKPMGNAFNDNARKINEHRANVASYFPAWDCTQDTDCDDGNAETDDTCNTFDRVCVFTPKETNPPSRAPISSAPTQDLSSYSSLGYLETFAISGVTDSWSTVTLSAAFVKPVPVCSVQYDGGRFLPPAVVRMQMISSSSFGIRLQQPSPNPSTGSVGSRNVKCIVVEAGSWELPDGNVIEARLVDSTVTDHRFSWVGSEQQFSGMYSKPIVIGQVTSFNDARWSVFWSRGADSAENCADQTNFWVGLHVGEDPMNTRFTETIGYIVMEGGTHSKIGNLEFEAGQGLQFIRGYAEGRQFMYYFDSPFEMAPEVVVVSQCKMKGLDGGWAVLTTDSTDVGFGLAVDEDTMADTERTHIDETVNFIAFSGEGSLPLVPQETLMPTNSPSLLPSVYPTAEPSGLPSSSGEGGFLQVLFLPTVDSSWTTIQLEAGFVDPVPVCTVVYSADQSTTPTVVRMRNVGATSFEVRLQNPSAGPVQSKPIHCLVVEIGDWEFGATKVEAKKYLSSRTDRKNDWVGERKTYGQEYANPVVLGSVMSFNNEDFSVFWSRGANQYVSPTADMLWVGKHIGEQQGARLPEVLGYIIIEGSTHGFVGDLEFEANTGAATTKAYVSGASNHAYMEAFQSTPEVVVVSQRAMMGNDGSWAVLTSTSSASSFGVAVDEDQVFDDERWHLDEEISYAAFAQQGQFVLSSPNSEYSSQTPSAIPSAVLSGIPTAAPSSFPSLRPSGLPSKVPTNTPTLFLSSRPSFSPSLLPTAVPSTNPSTLPTSNPSDAPSSVPSDHPTTFPSLRPSVYPSAFPSDFSTTFPSSEPTLNPSSMPSESPSFLPTTAPSDFPSSAPSDNPTTSPSLRPSVHPSVVPTDFPTSFPSSEPTRNPSSMPSESPSSRPTTRPSDFPSSAPSDFPTTSPSLRPSVHPSVVPTDFPTSFPSSEPTRNPSSMPSESPSSRPTTRPSDFPSSAPSDFPTTVPSLGPSTLPSSSPSSKPTALPSDVPSSAPSGVPSTVPSSSPSTLPSIIPSLEPSDSPSSFPSDFPTTVPSLQPTLEPSKGPTTTPSGSPSSSPSGLPSSVPSIIPTMIPSYVPSPFPTAKPSQNPSSGEGGFLQVLFLPAVDSSWATIQLEAGFVDPVPVCTVVYSADQSTTPTVVRMRNVGATSFEVRLQNPSAGPAQSKPIHCVVVEIGDWEFGATKVEAKKYLSSRTDRKNDWVGERKTYGQEYANPVVLGSVMSFNNEDFSVFWSRGANQYVSPTADMLWVGKHIGEQQGARLPEVLGYIIIEGSTHGFVGDLEFEANTGAATTKAYVSGASNHAYMEAFESMPEVVVVSQRGMNGNDGSWAVLTSTSTTSSFGVAVDEDQVGDDERWHLDEEISYVAFSQQGQFVLSLPNIDYSSQTPSTIPSAVLSGMPTAAPSSFPSLRPSGIPSKVPTNTPTSFPSTDPSSRPSFSPSLLPTAAPSTSPSSLPTSKPSDAPSSIPSDNPTTFPSLRPSVHPSTVPSDFLTSFPSSGPTLDPSSMPSESPSSRPTTVPSDFPNSAPSDFPTTVPSLDQSTLPSSSPSSKPTTAPSHVPTGRPSMTASGVPSIVPSLQPSELSSRYPSTVPSVQPSSLPTVVPTASHTILGGTWESLRAINVTSSWLTVPLSTTMNNPVVVCTVQYTSFASLIPAIVRMQNVQSVSFDIRLQSGSRQESEIIFGRDVHCLAVEEGLWELPDGRKIEATTYTSTDTDGRNSWNGEERSYRLPFTSPIVLGQIMTSNDDGFNVFWSRGGASKNDPPNSSSLRTGRHTGEYFEFRGDEVVGYIVMEAGSHTDIGGGIELESHRGGTTVQGFYQGFYHYTFLQPFQAGPPEVKVVSQAGMRGNDGSWAILTTHLSSSSQFAIAVDEDVAGDSERNHVQESLSYVAISQPGVIGLTPVPVGS